MCILNEILILLKSIVLLFIKDFSYAKVYFLEENIPEKVVFSIRCPLFELWASCWASGYTQLFELPCTLMSVYVILVMCE